VENNNEFNTKATLIGIQKESEEGVPLSSAYFKVDLL
jgi:hypothetical protein